MAEEIVPLKRRAGKGTNKNNAPNKEKTVLIHEVDKNKPTRKTTIEFDADLFIQMKIRVAERNIKMKDYIQDLIRTDIDK